MKVLMSQRDLRIPPNNFLFDCLERSWYGFLGNHHIIPYANAGVVDETIEFDCLVLSGGPDSVARNVTENNLFAHALKLGKPIFGVCHGAFAVNELTGGENELLDYELILQHDNQQHEITMEGSRHIVNSYHGQGIRKLGPDMVPLATVDDGTIEAFKHKELPIYGVVWHPERMKFPVLPKEVKDLIERD
jgi:putative glutamine amidotransferase